MLRSVLLLTLISTALAANCTVSVLDTLKANNETFSTLIAVASNDSAVATVLSGCDLTLFAPTNAAFAAFNGTLPTGAALTALLTYHVAPGSVNTSNLTAGTLISSALDLNKTLGGFQKITFSTATTPSNKTVGSVNGQVISNSSVLPQPTGGFVHAISGILVPPASILNVLVAQENDGLSTIVAAAGAVPAVGAALNTSDKLTAFIPTDSAFAALPAGYLNYLLADNATLAQVLEYHVVAGAVVYASEVKNESVATLEGSKINLTVSSAGVQVNGNTVVKANVLASNGVVHEIDGVLVPPLLNISTSGLLSALNLTALTDALKATNLSSAVFDSATPLTVFAPTNAAFADISDAIANASVDTIKSVLLNHVVAGLHPNIVSGTNLTTLGNTTLLVNNANGTMTVQLLNTSETAKVVGGPTFSLKLGQQAGAYYEIDHVLGVPENKKKNSSKGTPWAIIGGVIGGVVGLILILILVAAAVVGYMAVSAGGFSALVAKYRGYDTISVE